MVSSRWRCRLAAAALTTGLLLPSAAGAREPGGPFRTSLERNVFMVLWDLVSQAFQTGGAKNRGQIDPNGLTGTAPGSENDNRGQIDPDGLTGAVVEPDNDNRGQMDPNG